MCVYAMTSYKLHYACVSCRVSFKRHPPEPDTRHSCPNCSAPLLCAGHDFAAPPRRDTRAWSVVAALLAEGLRYEGRTTCGCSREPKPRPRSRAELRADRTAAERAGVPLAELLGR
ncbi:hypothetical protein ABZO31_27355 [Streptomyces sp. HUAS MG47]|uniref:hypothetical protein n=1 Tax=Streptomyces solicamelliae TaxID=3231716 RepID=UPI003877C68B